MNRNMLNLGRLILGLLPILGASTFTFAQTGYSQTNLVANTAGVANNTDAQLSNPWGISFIPGNDFWISNNNGGTSTLYDGSGNKSSLVVGIPSAAVNPCSPGCPTGTIANTVAGNFGGGTFLFDTEDGIIANWTGAANAATVVDNSASGAVYKGLAQVTNNEGTFLLAANFNSGKIDVFDASFNPTTLVGNLTDPALPAGYAPHGVHVIGNVIYIAYAEQDSAKHDPTIGAGLGVVDTFDLEGNFVSTFATGGTLNAPWGVVVTPASFGTFSSSVLIGNFGDGTINAFDATGKFLGQITDSASHVITNAGLWDMVFGAGGTGDPNTLYFTASGPSQTSGLFAALVPAAVVGSADFSLSLSAATLTVTSGGTGTLTIGSAAVGGFNGAITLSCAQVAGLTCAFSPATITPGSSTASSTLTLAATTSTGGGGGYPPMALLAGIGLFGTLFTTRSRKLSEKRKNIVAILSFALLVTTMTFMAACGSGYSSGQTKTTPPTQTTVMVTGTSGSLSHTVPITVTIN